MLPVNFSDTITKGNLMTLNKAQGRPSIREVGE
jgi:hypothetical protein